MDQISSDCRPLAGMFYTEFLGRLATFVKPASYFEIGTNTGSSLDQFSCDAVCVDPAFALEGNHVGKKRRSFFFQMTSDEFFKNHDLSVYLPGGVDIAFLDGLHRFEFLLRDFYNTERFCHPRSIVLMHDCLPSNARMAERVYRNDETEDDSTRYAWTGDVWKILPALKKYRPDLRIHLLDCPPTGLVAVTNLSPQSDALRSNYYRIIDEFAPLDLATFGLDTLRSVFPTLDSLAVSAEAAIGETFSLR